MIKKGFVPVRAEILLIIFSSLLSACTSTPQPGSTTKIITAYATSAARPWLTDLYACAANNNAVISISAESPDLSLRVGEPKTLVSHAYQIDEEEILIATHRESPVQNLDRQQAQDLFAEENASVQLWVYAADEDLQVAFDQLVMKGRGVASSARLAVSPQQMSDVLNSESNAVGILSRHLITGSVREVYSLGNAPVLAIANSAPAGIVKELIACLQK